MITPLQSYVENNVVFIQLLSSMVNFNDIALDKQVRCFQSRSNLELWIKIFEPLSIFLNKISTFLYPYCKENIWKGFLIRNDEYKEFTAQGRGERFISIINDVFVHYFCAINCEKLTIKTQSFVIDMYFRYHWHPFVRIHLPRTIYNCGYFLVWWRQSWFSFLLVTIIYRTYVLFHPT